MTDQNTEVQGTDFGSQLRALRDAAGLTQEELAEKAGLTAYAVSALERGRRQRPYPHTVRSLADALGASDAERAALMRTVPSRSGATATPGAAVPQPRTAAPAAGPDAAPPVPRIGPAISATRLLGRDEELSSLVQLLTSGDRRLVTLTGTGGVGKTRLATAVAAELDAAFPDGTVAVLLAPLADPSEVVPAIARAVGCPAGEGRDVERMLAEHLAPLRLLLVLDNLEHLLAAAEQIAHLVRSCPRLVALVTSRAPLRVRGESEYPLPPLAVPPPSADLAALAQVPAVAMFVDRARAVAPAFEVTADNAEAVAALCRRLAGIPLALELAAARVRFLNPQALLARLDGAMARGGGPDLPARQRTMRATFDWSYELLDSDEQELFRLLSVFVGGCTLEAVEQVAEKVGLTAPVLPLLEVLVEHSLVLVNTDHEGEPRFGMLEPVAQYARSRQDEAEARAVRDAHAEVFLAFAEQAAPQHHGRDQIVWFDRSEREDANLTAAISWSLLSGDADMAGRLGWELRLYWWARRRMSTGRRLMEEAWQQHEQTPTVRWHTVTNAAGMAFAQGDLDAAMVAYQHALELAHDLGDPMLLGASRAGLGLAELALGNLEAAERALRQAQPGLQGQGQFGDWLASLSRVWLGTVLMLTGRPGEASESMRRGLDFARDNGDRLTACIALYNLSQLALQLGALSTAREQLHEGIRLAHTTGDLANLGSMIEALAVVESHTGDGHRAAVLLGAAEAVREAAGRWIPGYYKPDPALREKAAADALAALGEEVYGDALDAGRAMVPDDAVRYALTGGR